MSTTIAGTSVMARRLRALAAGFRGEVVVPGSPTYEAQRAVWNGSIDRRPSAIARCAGVADVVDTIRCAREVDLELAVRSGGHSFPGLSVVDDGLVLDLSLMKGVSVDPVARVARVQAGVLLGEMDRETQAFGFAVPTGAVTHTGVAGLTLGGGIGWLMRRHGLAIDQLLAADVVTADGRFLHATATDHPELFWGLRGGGGNFGVVTEFTFGLQEVGPAVVSGLVCWSLDDAPVVARAYRDWAGSAPDELTSALVMRRVPPVSPFPVALHGRPMVAVMGCWSGRLDRGERYWAAMRGLGRPIADLTERRLYVDHQALLDEGYPHGVWVYMKACDVPALHDDVIDLSIAHCREIASPRSSVIAWQLGGAVARVDHDATAFAGRDAGHIINISGITEGHAGFEAEREWVRRYWRDLVPHQTSVYVNFLNDADTDRIRDAYGEARFDRLAALKATYDPDNVFHLNQNVPPAA